MSDFPEGLDPYDAVLNDLRARRDQIDAAIMAIESVRGARSTLLPAPRRPSTILEKLEAHFSPPLAEGSSVPVGMASSGRARVRIREGIVPTDFSGMTIAEAAVKLLNALHEPLSNSDLVQRLSAGGIAMNSQDPLNTMGSILGRREYEKGDIKRVGRGRWASSAWANEHMGHPISSDAS